MHPSFVGSTPPEALADHMAANPDPDRYIERILIELVSRAAADPTCDIEKMERLLAMHERMQAKTAKAAFNAGMAQMQCEMSSGHAAR